MATERRVRHRREVVAVVAVVVPLLAAAPIGAAERHLGPTRVLTRAAGLHQSSLSALAAGTPYIVKDVKCGSGGREVVRAPSLTFYAYGGDGGENAVGRKGGAGSVAVASYVLPVGTEVTPLVGCKGESARPDRNTSTAGGATSNGWPGGNGGSGIVDGESGGAGGGMSAWWFNTDPLIEAGGGGGAGGSAGGGPGGDGDRNGTNARTGGATGGKKGTFFARGAGGTPGGAEGAFGNSGGWGALGGGRIGGGGGGAGVLGGGGGGGGNHATLTPGAGGGGGGSAFYTDAGYVANFGGAGHGAQLDGLSQIVRVRPIVNGPYWPGWDIVRGVAQNGTKSGGYLVDAFGAIHTFSQGTNPPAASGGPYWPGWDIGRGIALLPDGTGGYVLDGFGGLHPFKIGNHAPPPAVTNGPYWPGQDIARGVTILPDAGGGYVLDGFGGLHPFAIGASAKPPPAQNGPYWPGFDIARGVSSPFELDASVAGGWIADSLGDLHPWGRLLGAPTPDAAGTPKFAIPLGRGIASFVVGAGGVEVDAYGGLHPFSTPGLP